MTELVGEVTLFAGEAVPPGWLPCDGAMLEKAAYPELAVTLGTTFGDGGLERFKLPTMADVPTADGVGALRYVIRAVSRAPLALPGYRGSRSG